MIYTLTYQGEQSSIMTAKSIRKRCQLNLTYTMSGRAGEAAKSLIDGLEVDEDFEHLDMPWCCPKTGRYKKCSLFAHAKYMENCAIHSLACYTISIKSQARSQACENFLFPELSHLKDPGSTCNKIIKDFIDNKRKRPSTSFPTNLTAKVISL